MTSNLNPGMIFNEVIWDSTLTGGLMYTVARSAAAEHPVLLAYYAAMIGANQPLLTYAGFDGIFKKKVNALSPILSTAICNGLALTVLPHAAKFVVSSEARFNAIAAIYMLTVVKGLTRSLYKTSIYPSLQPLAKLSFEVVKMPFTGVASIFDRVIHSQSVHTAVSKVSWLWKRNCDPATEHKEL